MKPCIVAAAVIAAVAACGAPEPEELVPTELQTVAAIDRISDTAFSPTRGR